MLNIYKRGLDIEHKSKRIEFERKDLSSKIQLYKPQKEFSNL